MNSQINDSIKEVFECVMLSNLTITSKFKLTTVLTEIAQEIETEIETDVPTQKVTVSREENTTEKTMFGHKRWKDEDRETLFKQVKTHFGAANTWAGRVTPPVGKRYDVVMKELANEFGRTQASIKAQIHDVVSNTYTDKNAPAIKKAKKVALDIGLINMDMHNN
jgi:hypothetical protein